MRLTDEMVELDDRKYRDRNVLVELKYMGREIKHRKTVTNDDLRFMAWLYRSALNLLKEQESVIKALKSDLDETLAVLGGQPEIVRCEDCKHWIPGYITEQDDFIPPKCGKYQQMVGHSADDYCSLAEKQEGR